MTQPFNGWGQQFPTYGSPQEQLQDAPAPPRRFGSNVPYPPFPSSIVVLNKNNQAYVYGRALHLNFRSSLKGFATLALVLFGLAIFVAIQWLRDTNNDKQLDQFGVQTQAEVTDGSASTHKGSTSYNVTYKFDAPLPDGSGKTSTFQKNQSVDKSTYDLLSVGSTVTIKYLKNDPTISEIPNQGVVGGQRVGELIVAAGLLFFSLFIVWLLYSDWRLNKLLEREGYLVEGRIESTRLIKSRKKLTLAVQYSFVNPQGQRVRKEQKIGYGKYQKNLNLAPGVPVGLIYYDNRRFKVM